MYSSYDGRQIAVRYGFISHAIHYQVLRKTPPKGKNYGLGKHMKYTLCLCWLLGNYKKVM